MKEKIKAIEKNSTWELITLPKGKEALGVKWVYKTKKNVKGDIESYKARLVVKGYNQLRLIMMRYTPLLLGLKLSD